MENQNALRALAGDPTSVRVYIAACLEDVKSLRQRGCKIKGTWTASQTDILRNEQEDTVAKEGTKDP